MKLKALLIDPFQRRVHPVMVEDNIQAWHKLLDCDCLDIARAGELGGQPIDIWVDDNGLLRNPRYPMFQWQGYHNDLAGYGLVLSSNRAGESISTQLDPILALTMVRWEEWEHRLNPEDYFDQLSRIYPDSYEGTFGVGAKNIRSQDTLFCCLCGNQLDDEFGNNPWPLVKEDDQESRCCNKCNWEKVIPARVKLRKEKS